MSYNGSGTFQINTAGQPVITGTVISSTAFNALTADLATGLSTAITKDGQTTTTARIPFAAGINSTLVTDSTNTTSGSIITAGGVGVAKAVFIGTTLNVAGASTMTGSIAVDSVTDSTSTTTGSIQTDGGVGIAKALFVGTTANIAGVTTFQAGTAALPAITTTGDTNTGIFFPAADTIAFSEGGAEAMRIDSSGNVGIGVTPSAKLQVNAPNFALSTLYSTLTSNSAIRTTDAQAANVGGELALGGFNNTSSISDFARIHGKKANSTAGNASGYFAIEVSDDNTGPNYMVERMRIDSSGNLLVGKTASSTSTNGFQVTESGKELYVGRSDDRCALFNRNGSDGILIFMLRQGGVVGSISVTASATAYNTSSDYRLKNTIAPMTGALDKVALLKPVTYKWNVDGSDGQGFIAHELAEVVSGCVTGEKDAVDAEGNPQYQGIDTSFLVATLTAAIQEQQALITALTARITALETA